MRIGTLSLLFAACLSFAQSERPTEKTDQSQTSHNAAKIDFWFIPASPYLNATKKQETTHDESHYGDLATWALVIVGIGGVIAALKTLAVIKRQTKAIEQQGDALINSERAWVVITPKEWNPGIHAMPQLGSATRNVFIGSISNTGKTIARLTESYGLYVTLNNMEELPAEPTYGTPMSHSGAILAPGDPHTSINALEPNGLLTEQQSASILNQDSFAYAYGFIRYIDVHDRIHETRYGYVYHAPVGGDTFPAGFRRAGPVAYNLAT